MLQPTLRKIDCVRLFVPDLDAALTYYEGQLGLRLVWRSEVAIGLAFPETDAELVIQTERPGLEVDILVDSADRAADAVRQAGGRVVVPPFDIRIGRCVVVQDPWANELVLLDMSKGRLSTDAAGNIIGNALPDPPP